MNDYPRAIYQPPASRPHWVNADETTSQLQYLSWGWRTYGRDPIPASLHAGWIYQLVQAGRAIATVGEETFAIKAGTLIVIGPGCASGWRGSSRKERCKILSWIWHDPPLLSGIRPATETYRLFPLGAEDCQHLERLHAASRNEIKLSDAASRHAIDAIKSQIDVLLARTTGKSPTRASAGAKLQYALSWLEKHPEELRPAAALADYLQVSPSTLNRLFRQQMGKNVREVAYTARMKVAREALGGGSHTVKELAFRLGYSHANDFTRAYSRFWGEAPSRMQQFS